MARIVCPLCARAYPDLARHGIRAHLPYRPTSAERRAVIAAIGAAIRAARAARSVDR